MEASAVERAELHRLAYGFPVPVYRDLSKSWKGQYTFINIDGDIAFVQLPNGRRLIQTCGTRPFFEISTTFKENACEDYTEKRLMW